MNPRCVHADMMTSIRFPSGNAENRLRSVSPKRCANQGYRTAPYHGPARHAIDPAKKAASLWSGPLWVRQAVQPKPLALYPSSEREGESADKKYLARFAPVRLLVRIYKCGIARAGNDPKSCRRQKLLARTAPGARLARIYMYRAKMRTDSAQKDERQDRKAARLVIVTNKTSPCPVSISCAKQGNVASTNQSS